MQDWLALLGAVAAHDGEDEDQTGKNQVRHGERPVGRPEPVGIDSEDNENCPDDPVD